MAAIPVAEYLSTTYRPDREYVDGVVLERNAGEHDHSRLQWRIAVFLATKEQGFGLRGFTEQRIRISETKCRIPDICVMKRSYKRQPVLSEPPLLVVEILSPDDRIGDTLLRIGDYQRFGVANIWIVDPKERSIVEAVADSPREIESKAMRLEVPGHTELLVVDFNELFRGLDAD